MDPVSAGFGAFAFVCELYRVSMATYSLYIDVKQFPQSFKSIRLALKIEKMRLKMWAECMGIAPDSGINERIREDSELLDLIQEIFANMKETFEASTKMLDDYGEAHSQSQASNQDEKPDLHRRISPGSSAKRLVQTYGRLVKWGALDKKKLEHLISELNMYNDKLYKLASPAEEASLRRLVRTQFVVQTKSTDLHVVQEAAAMAGHKDLEREAHSKAFVKAIYKSEELNTKFGATTLERSTPSDLMLSETSNSWQFEMKRLRLKGVEIMANHTRSMATYNHSNGEDMPILIDWSRCADNSWRSQNQEAFKFRLNNLSRVLNRDLLPHGFHVLQSLGYVFASSTTIGYVFRPPDKVASNSAPISLEELLSNTKSTTDFPELGTRFELAKAITTTLYEFHNIGWLHKNIHPRNILFFYSQAIPNTKPTLNLRKPYLVGFDLSRLNQPGELTEKPIFSESEDLYRHPAYRGQGLTSFKPAYDYFSLGIVLFEIALWKQASASSRRDSEFSRRMSEKNSWVKPYSALNPSGIASDPPPQTKGIEKANWQANRPDTEDKTPGKGKGTTRTSGEDVLTSLSSKSSSMSSKAGEADSMSSIVRNKAADLGRFVGARYRDAVLACVSMELDAVWEGKGESFGEEEGGEEVEDDDDVVEDRKERGRELALQKAAQKKVVDGIELCHA